VCGCLLVGLLSIKQPLPEGSLRIFAPAILARSATGAEGREAVVAAVEALGIVHLALLTVHRLIRVSDDIREVEIPEHPDCEHNQEDVQGVFKRRVQRNSASGCKFKHLSSFAEFLRTY